MDAEVASARRHVLRTFRWFDGHALFTPVFQDAAAMAALGPGLASPFRDRGVTAVISPEARGFVLGSLCAVNLGVGFVAARKPGSLRLGDQEEVTSEPDWRGRRVTFSVPRVFGPFDRVLLVDDWVETGAQATAIAEGIWRMGASLVGMSVIVDQAPASTRAALKIVGLLNHDELPDGG